MNHYAFAPGTIVKARGRDWVVYPYKREDVLCLRPLGGSDEDAVIMIPSLEREAPAPSKFPNPDPSKVGNYQAGILFRQALMIKLRNGAGPFRSFGHIAVEPRAYQLVPLLMAMKQDPVRLLIADDVGIGKTIEAGLIVRELWDRFEIRRFAVLCPPHLVEQWVHEIQNRFHFPAVALTSSSVARLERTLPTGRTIFNHYEAVVVSLDYIKSQSHRAHFLSTAPECIVVDEAHTCTMKGKNQQLRFDLVKNLSKDPNRHMILLTATPHSGDDEAFHNLLGILDDKFKDLRGRETAANDPLRLALASHFVQRRRKDIDEWQDTSIFPRRMTKEITYTLSGDWGIFFDGVRAYCSDIASQVERTASQAQHMIWYAVLALLRCVSSSPAAAGHALQTKADGAQEQLEQLAADSDLMDGAVDDLDVTDVAPTEFLEDRARIHELLKQAKKLEGKGNDPKLACLVGHLEELISEGFKPVVFCRYIATAHYVGEQLKGLLKHVNLDVITGELVPEEREQRVFDLAQEENPILIATDCLSEGVNLQEGFNAVVHYDLAWNPTRHEQREGRVDRFGQKAPEVRCTMIYGHDNPVDGFVLEVILRKAETIKKELGVLVPLPEDDKKVHQAMLRSAFLKKRSNDANQQVFDFGEIWDAQDEVESEWQDAMDKAKRNRTIFAQQSLHPKDVMPEWDKQQAMLGDWKLVEDFMRDSLARLSCPLLPRKKSGFLFNPETLPQQVNERVATLGIQKPIAIGFQYPTGPGVQFLHRSHPLVEIISEVMMEGALSGNLGLVSRSAAIVTKEVDVLTTMFLIRLRHRMETRRGGTTSYAMAEEVIVLACRGRKGQWLPEEIARELLHVKPSSNLDRAAQERAVQRALELYTSLNSQVGQLCEDRAQLLLEDHRRVRRAAMDRGRYDVKPVLPPDLMGVYVLLPEMSEV